MRKWLRCVAVIDLPRTLTTLLGTFGPLCERCLAHHAWMTLSLVAATLDDLRQTPAIRTERALCPRCGQFTQTFWLAETHEEGYGESR